MPTNEERAEYAAHGLDAYAINKEGRADYDAPEDIAGDMICDLLHLVRAHGVHEPLKILGTAQNNFEAEEAEEAGDDEKAAALWRGDAPSPLLVQLLKACRAAVADLTETVNYDEGDTQTLATVAQLEAAISAAEKLNVTEPSTLPRIDSCPGNAAAKVTE